MKRKIDRHYENLAKLYLRLKGYFVTNLILHSDKKGELFSEIDIIAVRMPLHSQKERGVDVDDYLESSNSKIEIIIADVKNVSQLKSVKFNESIRKNNKIAVNQLMNWIGVFKDDQDDLIKKVEKHLNIHSDRELKDFAQFEYKNEFGSFIFKFTFFCPSLNKWEGNGFKYIHGEEIVDFIWQCLNTEDKTENCNRVYNYEHWNEFEKYIRFFKTFKKPLSINDFEKEFENK